MDAGSLTFLWPSMLWFLIAVPLAAETARLTAAPPCPLENRIDNLFNS